MWLHPLNKHMHKNKYSLEVLVNGRPVTEYYKDDKSFVESRVGTEYSLRFRNNSWKRVMAIFSVDGIEVLKGQSASEAETGYIVDAFSSIEVKGYRIDDSNVAQFRFADIRNGYNVIVGATKKDSYGNEYQDKSSQNSGVIGVRVIEEDVPEKDYNFRYATISGSPTTLWNNSYTYTNIGLVSGCGILRGMNATAYNTTAGLSHDNEWKPDDTTPRASACSASSQIQTAFYHQPTYTTKNLVNHNDVQCISARSPNFDSATTWGQKIQDKVKTTSFKRSNIVTDIEIYYSSRNSLESYGIDFSNTKQIFGWPSAFEDKKSFCKLPPGYRA